MSNNEIQYKSRWYFGGLSAAGAVCFTHPLDLLKVLLQTQQGKLSMVQVTKNIVKENGVFSLYQGLSASVTRQLMYSLSRFAIYEAGKEYIIIDTFLAKMMLAGFSGACGGFIGTPTDVVNVRMQNDIKLSLDKRRNYKHVIDGLFRVYRGEGVEGLFKGASTASARGLLMTIGQIAFYDHIKEILLGTPYFKDDVCTHLTVSLAAGVISTLITQPLDVLKTRAMSAKPGEFDGFRGIIKHTAKLGPSGFFKGFIPAFLRNGPNTILLFVFYEQLRLNFGVASELP